MVWIYGGDLSSGAISAFDGTSMAANQDVVVVMVSYRVNGMDHSRDSRYLPT
jgi:carboxylesterase type B